MDNEQILEDLENIATYYEKLVKIYDLKKDAESAKLFSGIANGLLLAKDIIENGLSDKCRANIKQNTELLEDEYKERLYGGNKE